LPAEHPIQPWIVIIDQAVTLTAIGFEQVFEEYFDWDLLGLGYALWVMRYALCVMGYGLLFTALPYTGYAFSCRSSLPPQNFLSWVRELQEGIFRGE